MPLFIELWQQADEADEGVDQRDPDAEELFLELCLAFGYPVALYIWYGDSSQIALKALGETKK